MIGNPKNRKQQQFLYNGLEETLNPRHPLYQLSKKIPWEEFEKFLSKYYKNFGRPGKPIRMMVSLLILKQLYNLSDADLVERWLENPYWQYFSGETEFQWKFPCDSSELTVFRKRIGEEGVEKIFEVSIKLHGKRAMEREVIPDTTVQEKNITYPTDTKLHVKVIKWCWKVADKEGLTLRQSYKRTVPKLLWQTRYIRRPKRAKEGRSAQRKLKTIAGRLLRDVERKMSLESKKHYKDQLSNCYKVINQKRTDKNKIYSLHEPEVSCIAKGKEHKKYEFGSKASILLTKQSNIIVGALSFNGNPYDGNTLEPVFEQYRRIFGQKPEKALVDEGYRGRSKIGETEILRVHKKRQKGYSRWQWRQRFRRRAAVEPVIGHLKQDYRLNRNFLKGTVGDSINLMLACAAFNFKKLINELKFILYLLKKALKFNLKPLIFI